jgi:hypothetical protein
MAYTANQTPAQLAAALASAAPTAPVDAIASAVWSTSWLPVNSLAILYGVLVKVTTSGQGGAAPVFSYDATPS